MDNIIKQIKSIKSELKREYQQDVINASENYDNLTRPSERLRDLLTNCINAKDRLNIDNINISTSCEASASQLDRMIYNIHLQADNNLMLLTITDVRSKVDQYQIKIKVNDINKHDLHDNITIVYDSFVSIDYQLLFSKRVSSIVNHAILKEIVKQYA